jgi:hypothetical protein
VPEQHLRAKIEPYFLLQNSNSNRHKKFPLEKKLNNYLSQK